MALFKIRFGLFQAKRPSPINLLWTHLAPVGIYQLIGQLVHQVRIMQIMSHNLRQSHQVDCLALVHSWIVLQREFIKYQ